MQCTFLHLFLEVGLLQVIWIRQLMTKKKKKIKYLPEKSKILNSS